MRFLLLPLPLHANLGISASRRLPWPSIGYWPLQHHPSVCQPAFQNAAIIHPSICASCRTCFWCSSFHCCRLSLDQMTVLMLSLARSLNRSKPTMHACFREK
ncbi:hypothetical protein IWX50DRAFT_63199 [Phyllosticta citricarpa]